jgi:predicted RNA binding protein YcfA (HicA-like mRNA interferase family)
MSTFAPVTGRQLIGALRRLGFEVIRVKGSHYFLRHPDGRCTVGPVHRGEAVGPGPLARTLGDCDVSREELQEQL